MQKETSLGEYISFGLQGRMKKKQIEELEIKKKKLKKE